MASMMLHRCPISSSLSHFKQPTPPCHLSAFPRSFKTAIPPLHYFCQRLLLFDGKHSGFFAPLRTRKPFIVRAAGLPAPLNPQKRVETDFLPSDVRERTMKAVDDLGGRVTVGDIASRAGIKVSQAETALQALATDSGGFLEVSNDGDVLYVFPKDYRSVLATKSIKLKLEPVLGKLKGVADYLIRVSFGTALLVSIMLVYSTLMVLLTSSRSENDNRQGSHRSYNSGFSLYISPADLFWYLDPYYYRRRGFERGGLNFFESVFSFVFGDGDPNEGKEEIRWKMIGEYIKAKGGVVCAEELAPFLDAPSMEESREVESLMLPVLLRFDGEPEVDKVGNILYRFPSLQRTASRWSIPSATFDTSEPFSENSWAFSKANDMNQALVIGLGAVNFIGVVILSSWLRDAALVGRFGSGLVPFMAKVLPLLQVYTASFFAIPAVRWFSLQKKNADIVKRNAARAEWKQLLQRPDLALRKKLENSWNMAKQTVIGRDKIIYSTQKDISDQDFDVQDWESRFRETELR
ncbi:hypothetical protein L7F22_041707 [Adiantum nelumboides]|nr:hypothetical protein [Adiantum nelumboides]